MKPKILSEFEIISVVAMIGLLLTIAALAWTFNFIIDLLAMALAPRTEKIK